eukprot:CAMPEP_0181212208 /NCGR_PEP_ID=MMETSP1096-20121128/24223_1 /TAXON_ID=156174 ORGANISM="Chrysochromulina ericina, Strain CCMP281" /NCGR_SAMPLE_ID=MMETSP1096 /ASSEMBLY_ACC=CAM_ASM_000453 /LENGTH=197 /DNA_ID=CAMNT_0023303713 /DNA_START=570 /DNA_END=1160 /DNA_ORIENTATION=+
MNPVVLIGAPATKQEVLELLEARHLVHHPPVIWQQQQVTACPQQRCLQDEVARATVGVGEGMQLGEVGEEPRERTEHPAECAARVEVIRPQRWRPRDGIGEFSRVVCKGCVEHGRDVHLYLFPVPWLEHTDHAFAMDPRVCNPIIGVAGRICREQHFTPPARRRSLSTATQHLVGPERATGTPQSAIGLTLCASLSG